MDINDFQLHRIHIDTYFDSLRDTIVLRNTEQKRLDYLRYKMRLEEQRLNNLLSELQPQLYNDHKLIIDEQKTLILQLQHLIKSYKEDVDNSEIKTFQWLIEENKIETLYNKLRTEYINPTTTLETFKNAFSNILLSTITTKINWAKIGKNKHPNKKSILEFIRILITKNVISDTNLKQNKELYIILNNLFTGNDKVLIFKSANEPKKGSNSEWCKDLEDIVNSIL